MGARGAREVIPWIIDRKEDVSHRIFVRAAQWKVMSAKDFREKMATFDDLIRKQPKLLQEIDIDRGTRTSSSTGAKVALSCGGEE
jgi:hypothetical protein